MKKIFPILIILLATLISCNKESYFIEPNASFELSSSELVLFEWTSITNTGQGQFFSVYTGDPGHVYGDSASIARKTDKDGNLEYSYTSTGTFEIVYVATGYENGVVTESIDRKTVTVKEDAQNGISITKLNFTNETDPGGNFFGYINFETGGSKFIQEAKIIENNISIEVYQPFRVLKSDFTGNLSTKGDYTFIPNVELNSPTAFIEIDGIDEFVNLKTTVLHANANGDSFVPVTYNAVSADGTKTIYTVMAMCIPEFNSFSVSGVSGNIKTNPYNYNKFTIDLVVPVGTNLKTLTPLFTCFDDESTKVYLDDVEQDGRTNVVDFSNGEVVYDIIYSEPNLEDVFQSKSEITVTVSFPE